MTPLTLRQRAEPLLWPLLTVVVVLAVWHFAVLWSHTTVFPAPLRVERGLVELAHKHLLWPSITDSLARVAAGFGLATLIGVPLGLLLGWYPALSQVINPTLELPISPLAWTPLAIVFFGVGNHPAVFLIFLGAVFPILVAAANAVATIPEVYRRAARNFGLAPHQMLLRVVLPAALPQILVGLRLALGVAWLVVVAAEMIAVNSGLGFLIVYARNA